MAENNKQNQTARKTKAQILDEVVEKAHQQKQKTFFFTNSLVCQKISLTLHVRCKISHLTKIR